jgi:hypothetical protein
VWLVGIAMLALAALACDPPPVTGVTCLELDDNGNVVSIEQYNAYISTDGGVTWQYSRDKYDYFPGCGQKPINAIQWTMWSPAEPGVVYQFTKGKSIERSIDNGKSWQQEIDISGAEARAVYYTQFRGNGFVNRVGPMDALVEPKYGNLIVAMGYEGVLVRSPSGKWVWNPVDDYSRVDMRDPTIMIPVIGVELILALLAGILTVTGLGVLSDGRNIRVIPAAILVCNLIAWGIYGLAGFLGNSRFFGESWAGPLAGIFALILLPLVPMAPAVVAHIAARITRQRYKYEFWAVVSGWSWWIMVGVIRSLTVLETILSPHFVPVVILAGYVAITSFPIWVRRVPRDRKTLARLGALAAVQSGTIAIPFVWWAIGGFDSHWFAAWLAFAAALIVLLISPRLAAQFHLFHDPAVERMQISEDVQEGYS